MQVCVLGAGITGLAAAYELERRGLQVTVIDRALPGAGASSGNGAQLSYSYVQPLADPAIWPQLPRLLLSAQSPFKLRPQWDVHQWQWALSFLAACNSHTSQRSTMALLALAARSRQGLETMLHDNALACDFSRTGKLVLYNTTAALRAAQRQMALQSAWGCVQEVVSAQRCVEMEPALEPYSPQIAGAIYTASECAADCLKVCHGLHALLVQRGVRFVTHTEVLGFEQRGPRIHAVRTCTGSIEADQFVLSLGSASHGIARQLGFGLPIYPLKGYSITLNVHAAPHAAPQVSVTDAGRKIVFARLGNRLRVAGMAELAGHSTRIPPARIQALCQAAQAVFPDCGDFSQLQPWTGMRPATPTGLPIVGRHARGPANLLLNTGHGALGFTLAFGTAARIAELATA